MSDGGAHREPSTDACKTSIELYLAKVLARLVKGPKPVLAVRSEVYQLEGVPQHV